MPNLLQTGVAWLAGQIQASASSPVVYWRGAVSVPWSATFGTYLFRTTDARGNTKIERSDRDFIGSAAALILNGLLTQPQSGDWIDVTLNGVTERFEVMAPNNEAPWRYADPFQTLLRIHTKSLGVIAPEPPPVPQWLDLIGGGHLALVGGAPLELV